MSHHSHKPSGGLPSFITSLLSYGIGSILGGALLFVVGALMWGAFAALRAKPTPPSAAEQADAAPTQATAPSEAVAAAPTAAPAEDPLMAAGQKVYSTVCFACHQPTGLGLPNMFPPLAGSDWVVAARPDRMIRMVLHGFTGPFNLNGKPFASAAPLMPPQGAALSDEQIAAVLTYVRSSFGNKASAVTPDEVKTIREAEKARAAMWTEAELLKIPAE